MSGFVLEDRLGTKVWLTKSTVGVFMRVALDSGLGLTAELDPNQAAILHAKLGEMLGASAEEKFADRVDRLETSINALREMVSKLAPQAALDALATAFTEEMAKMKDRCDPVLAALAKAPLDDLPESDEERPAVDAAKRGSLLRMPLVTGHHGYSALTPEESCLFRAIEDVTERPLPAVSRVLPNVDVNTALVLAARSWWAKVAKPAIEAEQKDSMP